ncbi:rod-binding protein [Sandarakinorhabdus oryzae]|uniref:rod-binding protein n=1 Tax=Sandarakinorhabdus oryzae TaxID=2675220 RepID=UPI0012E32197|nr:rod-binding protein [Sandarakinorhabdus oryzae]
MEIRPVTLPLSPAAGEAKAAARAGQDFEALLVTRLLKTARAAKLGDDLLGNNDQVRDMLDDQRGRAIAQAAPLGLAQLLSREAAK